MIATTCIVESVEISDLYRLDPIQVFWSNRGAGQGRVTITCYDSAWTTYWNAMGDRTIQEFFEQADVGYLVDKLGYSQVMKQRKTDIAYLRRVVEAIQDYLLTAK